MKYIILKCGDSAVEKFCKDKGWKSVKKLAGTVRVNLETLSLYYWPVGETNKISPETKRKSFFGDTEVPVAIIIRNKFFPARVQCKYWLDKEVKRTGKKVNKNLDSIEIDSSIFITKETYKNLFLRSVTC